MKRRNSLGAVVALALTQIATAGLAVSPSGYATIDGNNITINAQTAPNGEEFMITGLTSDSIGDIIINTPFNTSHRIYVTINSTNPPNSGVASLRSLRRNTGTGEIWLDDVFIRGELGFLTGAGAPGLVSVNKIRGTITVRRNILADVVALGTSFSNPSGEVINAIVVPEDLPPPNSLCLGCDANDNSIHGSIYAYNGGIGSISVYNEIGNLEEQIVSQGPVGSITAGFLSGVEISMPGYDLGSLIANRGGWGGDGTADDGGNPSGIPTLPGSIQARKINVLQLKKDMQSELSVGFGPSSNQVWKIGGSLTSTGLLEFTQDQNLKHQIVINEQVDGGSWSSGGQVKVGNNPVYTLDDLYQAVPGVLGGGSVGAAPYRIHRGATVPKPSQTTTYGSIDYTSTQVPPPCVNTWGIGIQFYGKVFIEQTDQSSAVKVWIGPKNWDGLDPDNPNYPLVASDIEERMDVQATHSGRLVLVKRDSAGAWPLDKTYRIEVQPGKIKNLDLVTSSGGGPTYSPQEAYWFKVADGCREFFDLSLNGGVGGEDAGVWLVNPVDYNNDQSADSSDLDILLRGIDEHGGSND